MTTGNCKYEAGKVDSCFDCGCDECKEAIKQYEEWLNDKAKEEEFNRLMQEMEYQAIIDSIGGCHG